MNIIKNYFDRYKTNFGDWINLIKRLLNNSSKEEWIDELVKVTKEARNLYEENREIMSKLDEITDNLNDETALLIYQEVLSMYFEDYNDAEFVLHFSEKILPFYEQKKDTECLIHIYCICQNYLIDVCNPELYGLNYNLDYLKKGMAYLPEYKNLSDNARYRIIILYYTYLVRMVDYGSVSLKDALDVYDSFIAFMESDEIKKINENSEKIQNIIEYTKNTFSIGILKIDTVDEETRGRFYEYIDSYFKKYFADIESVYELSTQEYACYLFKNYVEKKLSVDDLFDEFLNYFQYKFEIIESQPSFEIGDFLECINGVNAIAKISRFVNKQEKIDKAVAFLTRFVEGRWIKGNLDKIELINSMLTGVCISLLSFDVPGIDKDKCLKQMVVQRNLKNYVQAELIADIAVAIYREISATNMDYFKGITSIPKSEWKDYLYYSCLFHNIGTTQNGTMARSFNRPEFPLETERFKNHIFAGKKMLESIPYLRKYDDIISGHHMYFDESAGYSDGFQRKNCDVLPILDIVCLAIYIEGKTEPYWDFSRTNIPFDKLLEELQEESGKRFNNILVDMLLGSKRLQNEINEIVTAQRESVIFDAYHNWEKIQLFEDEATLLSTIGNKIFEYRENHDEKAFEPYFQQLQYLAYNSKKDRTRGQALFYMMRFYFIKGEYAKAFGLEAETNKYLSFIKANEMLIKNYLNCGNAELIRENLETAMSKFLMALEIARRTPECAAEENIALASIANIYAKCLNYVRAKEYYDQVRSEDLDDYEKLKLYCMNGYCNAKIGNLELVKEETKKIKHLLIENENFKEFSTFAYLAHFSYTLGNKEEFEEYLDKLNKQFMNEEAFKYSSDEAIIFFELLEEKGDYEMLKKHLDYYIELCSGKSDFAQICMVMISKRMHLATVESQSPDHLKCERYILEALSLASNEKALHMEEMEKTFMENIRLQSEHTDFINEKIALEQSMLRAQNESEQKSQFLSLMSHEIRTPINAILGLNEMILRECNEDGILQYSTDINNAGKQLLGIVNDVLDYSKIEAGKMEIIPQKYYLGELVNDLKNMIEPKLAEKNLAYIVRCNPEIPNVLFGDDLRLKQILLNLLSNAYKYTSHGFVQFVIDYKKIDEKTINLSFEVKDSGVGLTESQIEKLSIPFERFANAKTRGVEGTGLGMSIVTKLLEQMDSKLNVSSVYGEGSVFSFEVSQGVIEWGRLGKLDDVKRKVLNQNVIKKKQVMDTVIAPDAKILVVDDNAVNLKVIQALLKRNKVQVTTALSGKECLELCKDNGYNIIFLDHMMPEMDGIETLAELKKMGGINDQTPVIALTANVTESGDEFYGKAGFDALLTKPVDFDKLEEALRKYLPAYLLK